MDEIIVIDKTLQERLNEYQEIFSRNEPLTVSQIQKEWSYFLEFSMDPLGWQAVWKIPRLTCEDFNISFPTIVLVYVEDIKPNTLSAYIKVLAVQDEISIPEYHLVPLMELYPTKEQDSSVVLDIQTTANSIDMLRFFYLNIFLPWDFEEEDTTDWIGKHLETRLRLFYDIKNGAIARPTAVHISSLLSEARRLQAKRRRLELQMEEDGHIEIDLDLSNCSDNKKLQSLVELHIKIVQIGAEIKLLENPLYRNIIISKEQEIASFMGNPNVHVWLVAKEGKIQESIEFLEQVKSTHKEQTVSISNDLPSTLEIVKENDTVVLCKGEHTIKTIGNIENGGTLKSFCKPDETLLHSNNDTIMIDIAKGHILIENLTIDASVSLVGIIIRSGKLTLKNCKLLGNGQSSIHQGIIVLPGSELEMLSCEMTKFSSAIIGNANSKITLKDCQVFNCIYGVKMYDKCIFNATNTTFKNCEEYGLCIETEHCLNDGEQKVGNFDVLNIMPDVDCTNVKGEQNFKGNVIVSRKQKFSAIKDLFSTTLVGDGPHAMESEEMETTMEKIEETAQ